MYTYTQHNRHVLWSSEATHPDIGGSENEDNDIWSQELHSTSVCNPGMYMYILYTVINH
jgi:Domain of unknown function (DUF1744)